MKEKFDKDFHFINIPFKDTQIYFLEEDILKSTKIDYHKDWEKKVICWNKVSSVNLFWESDIKNGDFHCIFCKDWTAKYTSYLTKVYLPEEQKIWFLLLNQNEIFKINQVFISNNKDNLFDLKNTVFFVKSVYKNDYEVSFYKYRPITKEIEKKEKLLNINKAKYIFFNNYDNYINKILKNLQDK